MNTRPLISRNKREGRYAGKHCQKHCRHRYQGIGIFDRECRRQFMEEQEDYWYAMYG